jgi:hypothetical protein
MKIGNLNLLQFIVASLCGMILYYSLGGVGVIAFSISAFLYFKLRQTKSYLFSILLSLVVFLSLFFCFVFLAIIAPREFNLLSMLPTWLLKR